MSRESARAILLLLLLGGGFLRLTHVAWDEGHHLHPDERFISMVDERLSFPTSLSAYFDSSRSELNPYNRGFQSFVYGTLPIFLTKAVARAFGKTGYDGSYMVGRILSAFFDLLTVWITYRITRRLAGRKTSLVASALLAFCPLGIQLSHFWAVDTFLVTFGCLALLGALRLASGKSSLLGDATTGLALGLAVACKVTALALLVPVGIAVVLRALDSHLSGDSWPRILRRAAGHLAVVIVATAASVRIFLPYAFLGFRLDPRYLNDMKGLIAISRSVAGFPPMLQWAGRTALFPLYNFVFWGAGPFFGIAALAGVLWSFFAIRRRERWLLVPLLAYAISVCSYHALTLTPSIRYFYPAYPALAILAALFLQSAARRSTSRVLRLLPAVVAAGTLLAGLAFVSIYVRPHPRLEASRWIYAHVPSPARFGNEAWDDGQPVSLPGHDSAPYAGPVFDLWGPDNAGKAESLLKVLAQADWIAITSGRVYMSITRLPTVFPMTTAYYRALFEGRLGFERAADFTSYPSLGPLRFYDDRAEEQFTVYDHPRVLLFRKTRDYSEKRARSILMAAIPKTPPTIWDWEKMPRSSRRVTDALVPSRRPEAEKAASNPVGSELRVGSFVAALFFYAALLLVGVVALPFTCVLFPGLADRGAGFARVFGLVVATYALSVAVQWRLLRNGRGAAGLVLLLFAAASVAVFRARRGEILAFFRARWRLIASGEVVFAAGFLLFAGLRAFNPEITWGEKPMDFSILNILVQTPTLPASDPWFAGAPLGYYTFGHSMVAFLTLLTGLSTRYTFNLAFGLLGGVTMQGAFSLLRNWTGSLRGGVAGAVFVTILGNLSGLREWLTVRRPDHRPLDWHYFWATSRVIKDTINEYPFWSLTFADLHAHVLSMPLFLLFMACAIQVVRVHADPEIRARRRILSAVLLGFAAAAQALTNAWDVPLLAGLLVLTGLAAAFAPGRVSAPSAIRAAFSFTASALAAVLFVLPLWVRGGGPPGFGRNAEAGARGVDILTVFGFFFFLALAWWLVMEYRRLLQAGWGRPKAAALFVPVAAGLAALGFLAPDVLCIVGILLFLVAAVRMAEAPEDRLAFGLVATGFFLVLFVQRLYIYDRMNTYFKLYFETWLVLAVGTTALLFSPSPRRGAVERWPRPLRGIFLLLLAACLFTTATGAHGALTDARPTLKGNFTGPTLDGLRYLESANPGEYQAVVWLRRTMKGTPVVLEAQGPSYQDFGRISMNTGFPTILGWDYHVKQRGNPEAEIEARKKAVEQIYSSPGAETIEGLLRRYHVGYVYVGWLERKTYPSAGLAKFDSAKDLFALVYENREAKIYRVLGGETQDVAVAKVTREALPVAPAATGPASDEPEESPSIKDTPAEDRPPFSGMREPRDAAVDDKGRLWVADFGNSRLRIFNSDGGYLGGWGGRGSGNHGFRELCGVAIRGDSLYVADTWNGRIQAFTLSGEYKATAVELYGPRGIAVAPDGAVWVTDTGNSRLKVYDAQLQGERVIGKKGSGPGEFLGPVGISVGPSGSVYVADAGNRRVEVLDSTGRFLRALPVTAWADAVEPHVEVDDDDTVYVSIPSGDAVQQFSPSGAPGERWTADPGGQKFARPTGLAIDRKNRILYVVNSGNNTVSKIPLPKRKTR